MIHEINMVGLVTDFEVEVDDQNPESWPNVLLRFSDASIYQSWAYGAVRWGAQHLSHLVLRGDGKVIAAAQLRIARFPLLPAGIAYLRWGPLIELKGNAMDSAIAVRMLEALREEYCGRRGLTLQIIPHAYSNSARGQILQQSLLKAGYRPDPGGSSYRTVLVDLSVEPDLMRKRLDQKWRNQLNRSEKNGFDLEISDDEAAYREFLRIYKGMWERKQFETSVDVQEFAEIQQCLPHSSRMLTFLARKDGETVGALVCSIMGDTAIYLLGATNERARELKASYFLQWQAMLRLKALGASLYDLGGINPAANPGGYHFKSGFGGEDVMQLPLYSFSGGILSKVMLSGVSWLRRRRAARLKQSAAF